VRAKRGEIICQAAAKGRASWWPSVVAIKEVVIISAKGSPRHPEEWNDSKADMLQTGDVVEELRIGNTSPLFVPFKNGKSGCRRSCISIIVRTTHWSRFESGGGGPHGRAAGLHHVGRWRCQEAIVHTQSPQQPQLCCRLDRFHLGRLLLPPRSVPTNPIVPTLVILQDFMSFDACFWYYTRIERFQGQICSEPCTAQGWIRGVLLGGEDAQVVLRFLLPAHHSPRPRPRG
jgi:hypothetical protein